MSQDIRWHQMRTCLKRRPRQGLTGLYTDIYQI